MIGLISSHHLEFKLKNLPFCCFGPQQAIFLSSGLLRNIEWILFNGETCFFRKDNLVNENLTNSETRPQEISKFILRNSIKCLRLRKKILLYGLVNLLLSPLVFLYQLFYFMFKYGAVTFSFPFFFN